MSSSYRIGDRVSLNDGRLGMVRYCGQVMFGPTGTWIGLELDAASGKNDGSVDGMRYFECKAGHGLFVQPERLTLLRPARPVPKPAPMPPATPSTPASQSAEANKPMVLFKETPAGPQLPPFQVSEATSRILEMSAGFGQQMGEEQQQQETPKVNPEIRRNQVEAFSNEFQRNNFYPQGNPFTVELQKNNLQSQSNNFSAELQKNNFQSQSNNFSADLQNIQLENAQPRPFNQSSVPYPTTPVKNIIDMAKLADGPQSVVKRSDLPVPDTPGSSALSRELERRQDEVNMIRREVEPLLQQTRRAALSGPTEHVKVLVDRLSLIMGQYDKVVARYERQLQKLIIHMDKRRTGQLAVKEEAERSAGHRLSLQERELEDLKLRLSSAENQARTIRKEYEQAQRNLANRIAIEEDLRGENERLRSELASLKESNGTKGSTTGLLEEQVEMLTASIEASRAQNSQLQRLLDLSRSNTESDGLVMELQQAKDRQEAYFKEQMEVMKGEHTQTIQSLNRKLAELKDDLAFTKEQLEEQQQRALKYSQAIDSTADKLYGEQKGHLELLAQAQSQVKEREVKIAEMVDALERMSREKREAKGEMERMEKRISDLSRLKPTENHPSSAETRKQISVLEQTVLEMAEEKSRLEARLRDERERAGKEAETKMAGLQRQLAQVEFEKRQIEGALERERAKPLRDVSRNGSNNFTNTTGDSRIEGIKRELASLPPPKTLLSRLSSLLSTRQTPNTIKPSIPDPRPLNVEAINRAVHDIQASFEGLEATRVKALACAKEIQVPSLDLGEASEMTPTRRRTVSFR